MLNLMRPMFRSCIERELLRSCIQGENFVRYAAKKPPAKPPTKPPANTKPPAKPPTSTPCGPGGGSKKKPNPAFEKVKKMQVLFQKDDGKPVFLKGGKNDLLLYRITWGLCLLGLLLDVHLFAMYIIF